MSRQKTSIESFVDLVILISDTTSVLFKNSKKLAAVIGKMRRQRKSLQQ
jgi:hypothetical protein